MNSRSESSSLQTLPRRLRHLRRRLSLLLLLLTPSGECSHPGHPVRAEFLTSAGIQAGRVSVKGKSLSAPVWGSWAAGHAQCPTCPQTHHPDQFWTVSALPSLTNCLDFALEEEGYLSPLNLGDYFFFYSPDSCNYRLVKCFLLPRKLLWTKGYVRLLCVPSCQILMMKMQAPLSSHNHFHNLKRRGKKEKITTQTPSHQAVLGKITKIWLDFCKGL